MTLDSLPPSIEIDGHIIWLNITKEMTGTYSGGYVYETDDNTFGFYLNNYPTIELLSIAILEKLG